MSVKNKSFLEGTFQYGIMPYIYGIGAAIVILGALFGASVAMRQILLHIVPATGTYGSPIFGLHPYTWSFIFFAATLLAVALLLLVSHPRCDDQEFTVNKAEHAMCWAAVIVTGLNVIAAFLECGPLICPEDPTGYELLK